MVNNQYVLMESALGYALFRVLEAEEISIDALSKSMKNFNSFKNMIKLQSFIAHSDQESALSAINDISEGLLPDSLLQFLKTSLPDLSAMEKQKKKDKKKHKKDTSEAAGICLGVADANLGNAVLEQFERLKQSNQFTCRCDDVILEIIRGCREYLGAYIASQRESEAGQPAFNVSNLEHANIALGHSYSRAKIKYNVNRVDNMIIQAICILDQIDKDINTYCMRCKEWYGWHFPELTKIVNDQIVYARVMQVVKEKSNLKCLYSAVGAGDDDDDAAGLSDTAKQLKQRLLVAVGDDEELVQEIINVSKTSMGIDVSKIDMIEMCVFATRIVRLAEFRIKLYAYLCEKMECCAPNLTALMGQQVGARLISKAGSLIKLAKYPASTLQILGAEKALFRALKSKGKCNTPKYGLIYNSTFIMKAKDKNKGRISRYLANKASMAVRLDCFMDKPTNVYGIAFRDQVEQRLTFFKDGKVPSKNIDVMTKVRMQLEIDAEEDSDDDDVDLVQSKSQTPTQKTEKKKMDEEEEEDADIDLEVSSTASTPKKEKKKKKKKDKKRKLEESEEIAIETPPTKKQKLDEEEQTSSKKKKKKKKDKQQQQQEEEMEVQSTPPSKQEANTEVSSSEKKKKKKKKKKVAEEVEQPQAELESPQTSEGDSGKKKKKKKKKKASE
eukprot:CAMPEP_0202689416 /NCGR_PEP_ID=MMETSP1385-20130828/4685_1 /ASSEMBLY_ACC=CAM_ASM_000861 /TAXON_ID=933848 /ORGANISM="Elphidium margaritaceum" /LENGTH=669 /DNA_ID=CAMNT_0049344547 /DNA_START=53 /DNA_END=2062 /DNA_ORIENTATION=-